MAIDVPLSRVPHDISRRLHTGKPTARGSLMTHLAAEDPRRVDLERKALSKLRRVMPHMQAQYISATSIGLSEQTSPRTKVRSIWYELADKQEMSRVTTAEGVFETIYALAGVAPPPEDEESVFRGHPLAVPPKGAAIVFYGIWPAVAITAGILIRRRNT